MNFVEKRLMKSMRICMNAICAGGTCARIVAANLSYVMSVVSECKHKKYFKAVCDVKKT